MNTNMSAFSDKWKINSTKLFVELTLIVLTCVYLWPFYIVIVIAVKLPRDLLYNPASFPTSFHLENFVQAWEKMKFPLKFMNSFIVTGISSVGIAMIAGMASFTLAKRSGKLYTLIYYIFIAGLMIPFYMTLTPLMKLMKDLGLMDNIYGLALAYIGRGIPFAILLYVGFIRGIPKDISDSAVIDGCTPIQTYTYIIFPMIKHVTSTLIILNVLSIWNDFLLPLLVLNSSKNHTLPIVQRIFYGENQNAWNLAFASFLLSMLPLMFFYFLLQKNIVEGIATGAIKG